MWDGLDRFCKAQEHSGRVGSDLKEFQLQTQKEIQEIYRQIATKLNEEQYKKETKTLKDQQRSYSESCTEKLGEKFSESQSRMLLTIEDLQKQINHNRESADVNHE